MTDILNFGITSVAAITVIAYVFGVIAKAINGLDNKFIPIICMVVGAIFGVIGMYVMPEFPATNWIDALAVGIISGVAATGINQALKQVTDN